MWRPRHLPYGSHAIQMACQLMTWTATSADDMSTTSAPHYCDVGVTWLSLLSRTCCMGVQTRFERMGHAVRPIQQSF
ncbi:hypothetical protein LIER_16633 [Lithospermum erythrorhizon]|uniref:Secreted protein n=1 Tax=Lithospermum erythrorhizon TaxID=34254 RepID=A0AAV3Q8Z4_LITER